MADVQKTFDEIKEFSITEVAELVKMFEEEFDISAAAPVAVAAAPGAEAADGGAEEEKTAFDVVLAEVGDKKIQVIKVVRAATGLGLKEAKAVVDSAPKPVMEGISQEDADELKGKLEEVGATIEIK